MEVAGREPLINRCALPAPPLWGWTCIPQGPKFRAMWTPWPKKFELVETRRDIIGRLDRLESVPTPTVDPEVVAAAVAEHLERIDALAVVVDELASQGSELDDRVREYVIALAEGIERVDRSERRVKATVARARKELEASGVIDPGVEAEAEQLRLVDAAGGSDRGMYAVPAEVEVPAEAPSSIPGVSAAQLRSMRGG